jgi:hypothetical protein
MAVKLANYLFTGPLAIAGATHRSNRKETVFAIISKAGSSWDPVFRLLDLGRTGPQGIVFATDPRAGHWRDGDGRPASVYLLDVATQFELADELDEVMKTILARYPIPSDIH